MTQNDWRMAYEPLPPQLETRVKRALAALDDASKRRFQVRTAVLVLALVLALCGVACAVFESRTVELFGRFYGEGTKRELLSGDLAGVGQSVRLGEVVYTLDDAVYKDGTVYASGTIRPADGVNVVLLAEDYSVNDPAGYLLFYGEEEIPDDAPTYAELAQERGAKILHVDAIANGVLEENGELNASSIGYGALPQRDGTIRFFFEFEGGESEIARAEKYEVSVYIANWEVTPEGEWLREEPENTWLYEDWTVTVEPQMKEDGK